MSMLPENYAFLLDLLREQGPGQHRTIAEMYAEARRRRPGIGYSTVQRALQRLAAQGLVLRVRIPGSDATLYESAPEAHAHFACRRCGAVIDVPYVLPQEVRERLSLVTGLRITGEDVTFTGFCSACRGE